MFLRQNKKWAVYVCVDSCLIEATRSCFWGGGVVKGLMYPSAWYEAPFVFYAENVNMNILSNLSSVIHID